jgi:hypothetical protein
LENAYNTVLSNNNHIFIIDVETTGLPIRSSYNSIPDPSSFQLYKNARVIEIAYKIYE